MGITDEDRKLALLIHYGGDDIYNIVEAMEADKKDTYNHLKTALNDHFSPQTNSSFEVFKFRQCQQEEGEGIDAFVTRLRNLSLFCDFENKDKEILAQIIQGTNQKKLRRKALKDNLSLKDTIKEAKSLELSDQRAIEMEAVLERESVNAIESRQSEKDKNVQDFPRQSEKHKNIRQDYPRNAGNRPRQSEPRTCDYCGYSHKPRQCPAYNKHCTFCNIRGHFSRVCRKAKAACSIMENDDVNENISMSDHMKSNYTDDESENVFNLSETKINSPNVMASVDGAPCKFILDSGSTVNIINHHTFKNIQTARRQVIKLNKDCPKIFAYAATDPLPLLGYFVGNIRVDKHSCYGKIYVLDNIQHAKNINNLLSCQTTCNLHLAQFVSSLSENPKENIFGRYQDLFDGGMGKIKGHKIHLHINDSVQPLSQTHRRIPFHLRSEVEKELERLEKLDVIEKVEGPTPWVSPAVIVPKQNGKIRICIDMRKPNEAISREKHPMPTLDDLIADLNGACVFSKLDLSNAYHQLELDEASRYITTFSTHVGLRRYKRLLFGINAASEIFQNKIAELLHDIHGSRNLSDDIIIFGKSRAEHDKALDATLRRLEENGAKLNRDKCVFGVEELKFFGHIFSKDGIRPDPEKIETITKTKPPENAQEVRSFLGMTQYVARFIENYSAISEPLRNLTKKDSLFVWGDHEKKAFDTLKSCLIKATNPMRYFNMNQKSELIVDGSPLGCAAILTQHGRPICYASRAMTDAEKKYSQIEREMLAIVFGVEHFHLYLFGSNFTIVTDHKPLLGIVKSLKPTTARIERLRLRLMPYNFDLIYKPGRDEKNPADYLSRHPHITPNRNNVSEEYIAFVTSNSMPDGIRCEDIKIEIQKDKQMLALMHAILTNDWSDIIVSKYKRFKDELSVYNGLILRGERLIVPISLQDTVLNIAHKAHQGIVKIKQFIRSHVWFPDIDKRVEDMIKSCIPCQVSHSSPENREPIQSTQLPDKPWSHIAIDFSGPYPTGEYALVVVDEYSRYPEIELVSSTNASLVISKLDSIFARHGFPDSMKSDNGPPFQSKEFATYCKNVGIKHTRITPLWPEANGEVERFMRTLNQHVQSSTAANLNWKQNLPTFLRQYRGTPHSSTGKSPHLALTGRHMNVGIPFLNFSNDQQSIKLHREILQYDNKRKLATKLYADAKRHTKQSDMKIGDTVLAKQRRQNKLTPKYNPKPYIITNKKGSCITAKRGHDRIIRNSSFFKRINIPQTHADKDEFASDDEEGEDEVEIVTPNKDAPISPSPQMSTSDSQLQIPTRPVRDRRPPSYLKDYVVSNLV